MPPPRIARSAIPSTRDGVTKFNVLLPFTKSRANLSTNGEVPPNAPTVKMAHISRQVGCAGEDSEFSIRFESCGPTTYKAEARVRLGHQSAESLFDGARAISGHAASIV